MDFLLGARVARNNNPLRDIPQRDGYDRARLILRARDNEVFTLQRSTSGGGFNQFEGSWLINEPNVEATNLSEVHEHGNCKTLSAYILSLMGLEDKRVQKNRQGETQSLSFRNLVRLIIIQEDDVIKKRSPIFSGRNPNATVEYSVFKLLLTGVDDSALVEQARIQSEMATTRQNNRAKLEFITELIQEQQSELEDFQITRTQAEERISSLETQLQRQQEILTQFQQNLNSRIERRREISGDKENLTTRINEISSLLSRFELLKEHYRIDLERLTSIEESGSLFVHLERTPCPLCGALPNEQHQVEMCDGDIENIVNAAAVEIAKVQQLSEELDQTSEDLRTEAENLNNQREQLEPELQSLNREIQEINSPLSDTQNTFSELINQSSEMQRIVDAFSRIEQMQQKRASLLAEISETSTPVNSRVDLSTSILDDFAETVQRLLRAWNFPGSDRVSFDEARKDLVIGGQLRTSRGKGLRAVTHAAMTIGLMDFCKERNLSHPGFVVLDSPLLAYWQPEASEDKDLLEGVGLRENFYEYLANNYNDSQILIIENELPPDGIEEKISLTNFTGNPNEGRCGFFPVTESSL
ncbi:MAG: hypothetical protein IGR80_10125 [Synechococcales cyanobacterium K44_A2020_017]|nr:hypothetical protein [Synechococcales cyanobacterium K32_A2020_035]MBF2095099.1 hypothetical protein [Synechococcales cyanobacterium K44_A2020_017]